MKLRKLNRVTHRDVGYLIAGLTLIYTLSGIALNHKSDWNPNYIVEIKDVPRDIFITRENITEELVLELVELAGESDSYKTWYLPAGNKLSVFLDGGSLFYNLATQSGYVEKATQRPIFYQINFLHYNPGKWWKWFSDIYCIALMTVTITGLFIIKGKNGITRRGAILTVIGIVLPLIFLFIY